MNTIERMARAMAEVIAPIVKQGPQKYSGLTQEDMLDAARAALQAVRDDFSDPVVRAALQVVLDEQ